MTEFFEIAKEWFFSLGDNYGVNPIIFGSIYVGAIPFFTLSIGWLVRNYRQQKSIVLPALSSIFFFISAYLYLIIAGENVPLWVYGAAVLMIGYGAWSTYKRVKNKVEKVDSSELPD
jgi:ABC-type Co2+ transport system permease subunit